MSSLVDSIIPSDHREADQLEIRDQLDRAANPVNIVIIDPNDEYLGLFIDKFVYEPDSLLYIHVGVDSLPQSIVANLGQGDEPTTDNVNLLHRQMHLPLNLRENYDIQDFIRFGVRNALTRTSLALPVKDLSTWLRNELRNQTPSNTGAAGREALLEIETAWTGSVENLPITPENLQIAIDLENEFSSPVRAPIQRIQPERNRPTVQGVVDRTVRALERYRDHLLNVPPNAILSFNEIIHELNSSDRSRIIIITGKQDFVLKQFCSILGNELYESRRIGATGTDIEPYTVLLLDEADLFIPSDVDDDVTKQIKETCITIARRGRKYNLGIGISTQRASMLDTQVMGNLHTYFVSKLPRRYDRDKIAEAFGIGEEELSPTFTFRPGHWLIISHDATGLKGVPIPTTAYNANERIIRAANEYNRDNGT